MSDSDTAKNTADGERIGLRDFLLAEQDVGVAIKGYVVQRIAGGGTPTTVHATYHGACAEAERLALMNGRASFAVVVLYASALSTASVRTSVEWEDLAYDDDEDDVRLEGGYE